MWKRKNTLTVVSGSLLLLLPTGCDKGRQEREMRQAQQAEHHRRAESERAAREIEAIRIDAQQKIEAARLERDAATEAANQKLDAVRETAKAEAVLEAVKERDATVAALNEEFTQELAALNADHDKAYAELSDRMIAEIRKMFEEGFKQGKTAGEEAGEAKGIEIGRQQQRDDDAEASFVAGMSQPVGLVTMASVILASCLFSMTIVRFHVQGRVNSKERERAKIEEAHKLLISQHWKLKESLNKEQNDEHSNA